MELAVECPICMDEYVNERPPITLQCGHTYCVTCVRELIKKDKKFNCPLDKQVFTIASMSPNYEMLHIIEECKLKHESYQRDRQELESRLTSLQSEISESVSQQEDIKEALKQKYSADLVKKVSSAVIETEEKGKKRLKKKLKEQELKLRAKLEKKAQLIKEIEEKKREETLNTILKQKEEEMNHQKKLTNELKTKFEDEKKKLAEDHKKNQKTLEKELTKKLEEEKKQQEKEMMLKYEQSLLEEKMKIEKEAKEKQDQLIAKLREEQIELVKQQALIKRKEQQIEKEYKERMEMLEKENKEKQEREENMKKMVEEQMAKAQAKVNEKIRIGKLPGNQANKQVRENMQRDNNRVYWAFKTPNGNYLEYYEQFSGLIEKAFMQNKSYVYLRNRGNVDFFKWKEVKDTGEEVMIKRVNSFCGPAQWSYLDDSGWLEFNDQDNFDIEKAWLTKQPNCMVMCGNHLDFNSLTVSIRGLQRPVLRDIIRKGN